MARPQIHIVVGLFLILFCKSAWAYSIPEVDGVHICEEKILSKEPYKLKEKVHIKCGEFDPSIDEVISGDTSKPTQQCIVNRTSEIHPPPVHTVICCQGWKGENCLKPICTVECQNGGSCYEPDLCLCPDGILKSQCDPEPEPYDTAEQYGGYVPTFHNESAPRRCSLLSGYLHRVEGDHFNFNGQSGSFYLASECGIDPLYRLIVKTDVPCFGSGESRCYGAIIEIGGAKIELSPGGIVLLDSKLITRFPFRTQEADVTITNRGGYCVIENFNGLQIVYNGAHTLDIVIPAERGAKVCGLCGSMHLTDTGFVDPQSNERLSYVEFFYKMAVPGQYHQITGSMELCQDTQSEQLAKDQCRFLLEEPFAKASYVLDLPAHFGACLVSVCNCLNTGSKDCQGCEVAEHAAFIANNQGVPVTSWRTTDFCPYQCPHTMVFQECASCLQSCSSLGIETVCPTTCVPGCVCPEGHVFDGTNCVQPTMCPCTSGIDKYPTGAAIEQDCNECVCTGGKWDCTTDVCAGECTVFGSGLVKSFDGRLFHNTQQCKYTLLRTYNNIANPFAVFIDLKGCYAGNSGSYFKEVETRINGVVYKFESNTEVKVGNNHVRIPYSGPDVEIEAMLGHMVQVTASFGMVITMSFKTARLYIKLLPEHQEQVFGMCGNFNGKDHDDSTYFGLPMNSHAELFSKWVSGPPAHSCLPRSEFADPLAYYSQARPRANNLCNFLKSDVFASCARHVNPEIYFDQCLKDVVRGQICGRMDNNECSSFAAYGRECALKGEKINWHSSTVCEPQCQEGMEWRTECKEIGATTCTDLRLKPRTVAACADGCFCEGNKVLDQRKDICVEPEFCPCMYKTRLFENGDTRESQCGYCECSRGDWTCYDNECNDTAMDKCHNGQVWSECTQCEKSCTHREIDCLEGETAEDCDEGCACPSDQAWDGHHCVPVEECPCIRNGDKYQVGETVEQHCQKCVCTSNGWDCDEEPCTRTCRTWGDPHYETFDGLRYDFQGDCSYVLVEDNCGSDEASSFKIMVENVPCGAGGVSCTKAIKFIIRGTEIRMVGGAHISVTNSADAAGFSYQLKRVGIYDVIETKVGITLKWDRGTTIYVTLDPRYINNVCGLCGNFNGLARDDFTTPQGELEENPVIFGHSWRASFCELPSPPSNPCDINPSRRQWAEYACSIIKQGIFLPCHSEVEPEKYYADCVMDTCACDRGGDCECLCTAIAAYTQQCSENGVALKWRSDGTCGLQCEDGKEYSECGSSCESACYVEGQEDYGCEETCVEGCFCPPGQVEFEGRCIVRDLCPCYYNGIEIPAGEDFEKGDKCCHCYSGDRYECYDGPCPTRSTVESTPSCHHETSTPTPTSTPRASTPSTTPETTPTSTPVTTPSTTPVTTPSTTPVTTPSTTPSTTPVTTPSTTPFTTTPSTTPVTSTPSTTPVTTTPSTTPVPPTPSTTPVTTTPSTTPVTTTPSTTPVPPTPSTTPVTTTPSTTPVTTPSTTPVTTPHSTTPVTTPSTTPVTTPSTTPVTTPSNTPVTTPSTTPVTTPSTTPVTTPSTTPVTTPFSTPVTTPSTTPVTTPSTTPVTTPSTTPVTTPSTTPVTTPSTTPVPPTPSTTPVTTTPSTSPVPPTPSTTPVTTTPSTTPVPTTPSTTPVTTTPSTTPVPPTAKSSEHQSSD